jgi:actin-related protein 5
MAKESTSVQFPYPIPDVVHRSEEELAAMAEKRKEQGKKLQEITQKRNREKVGIDRLQGWLEVVRRGG